MPTRNLVYSQAVSTLGRVLPSVGAIHAPESGVPGTVLREIPVPGTRNLVGI